MNSRRKKFIPPEHWRNIDCRIPASPRHTENYDPLFSVTSKVEQKTLGHEPRESTVHFTDGWGSLPRFNVSLLCTSTRRVVKIRSSGRSDTQPVHSLGQKSTRDMTWYLSVDPNLRRVDFEVCKTSSLFERGLEEFKEWVS